MLDIKFIRENKELIEIATKKKHLSFDVNKLIEVDTKRKELMTSIETKKAEQGVVGEQIVNSQNPEEKSTLIASMQEVKKVIQELGVK